MACRHVWESRGVHRVFSGHTTGDEITQAVAELTGYGDFDAIRYVINDLSACDTISFDQPGAEVVTAYDVAARLSNARIKVAIVATTPRAQAAAEAYLAVSEGSFPTKIFHSLAQAREWVADY